MPHLTNLEVENRKTLKSELNPPKKQEENRRLTFEWEENDSPPVK
jgi:hypothetical protein